ncbi:MAG: hypothetical protein SVY53_12090 [Chloroflexota bacterium]|nr:hypothetical protein [Chloroflexota bacterium]
MTILEGNQPPPPEPGKLHSIGSWYIDEDLKDKLQLDMAIGMIEPDSAANLGYLVNTLHLDRVNALIYGPHLGLSCDKLGKGPLFPSTSYNTYISLGWSPQQMLQAAHTIGEFSKDHPEVKLLLDDFWATADTIGHSHWEKVVLSARQFNPGLEVSIVVYPFQIDRHLFEGWQEDAHPNGVSLWVWDWQDIKNVDSYYQRIMEKYDGKLWITGGCYVTDYVHDPNSPIPVNQFQDLQDYWCEHTVKGTAEGITTLFYPDALRRWPEYVDYANDVYKFYR